MTDISPPDFSRLEVIHPVFGTIWNRLQRGYYTVKGGAITESGTPDMDTNMSSWRGYINGVYVELAADSVTHDASNETDDRVDIVYLDAEGMKIHKGADAQPLSIDPDDPTNWHKFVAPFPADSIPDGVILALVYVPAGATAITDAEIWEIGSLPEDGYIKRLVDTTIAKGAPRAQDTPDMTIYVPAFVAYINGALVSFAGGNSAAMVAPVANPRIDRVYLTAAGALAITAGEEAGSPTPPALVAGTVPICLIYHRVGATSIKDADDSTNSYIYRDDRPLYQGVGASGSVSVAVPYDDADGEVTLLTMPADGFIRFVGKVVGTAYDDGSVTVGEDGDEANLMAAALVDAQGATNDTYSPNAYYASGSVIKAFITPGSATEGTFTLILEYVTV